MFADLAFKLTVFDRLAIRQTVPTEEQKRGQPLLQSFSQWCEAHQFMSDYRFRERRNQRDREDRFEDAADLAREASRNRDPRNQVVLAQNQLLLAAATAQPQPSPDVRHGPLPTGRLVDLFYFFRQVPLRWYWSRDHRRPREGRHVGEMEPEEESEEEERPRTGRTWQRH